MHRVTRTFHPIGQGAFYSEEHWDVKADTHFNIVYDCGSMSDIKHKKDIIESAFGNNDTIHILFISHFDSDHVNGITILMNKYNIETVVMPLLHDEQKYLLTNLYSVIEHNEDFVNLNNLINNPTDFFKDSKVITVEIGDPEQSNNNDETEDQSVVLEDIKNGDSIQSGTLINYSKTASWCFIPYNIKNASRSAALEIELKNNGFDVARLKNDPGYALNNISTRAKELRKIYNCKSIRGTVNENSMLLYSGPKCSKLVDSYHFCLWHHSSHYFLYDYFQEKIGCIYTGDMSSDKISLKNIFPAHIKMVGTVQVPHHGSIHHQVVSHFAFEANLICPVSYGTTNNYRHPNITILHEIYRSNCIPVLVNENKNSKYIQKISF